MKGLDGKVALIGGGEDGIGRSIALALAARGVRVLVTGPGERALGETVGEIAYGGGKARHLAGDLTDGAHAVAAVDRAIEVFGGLDIVVMNGELPGIRPGAGAAAAATLLGARTTFDAAASRMRAPGRLVVTGSTSAGPELSGLVRGRALELGPRGGTCNAVLAGVVETDAVERQLAEVATAEGKTKDDVRAAAAASTPLGRFVEPEEIAALVVFLCSRAGDAVTGQTIAVGADRSFLGD